MTSPEGARVLPVRFASFDGCDIQGFLITLDDLDRAGPPPTRRPLVVTTHGYNSQCNPVLEARHAAACRADLFCFDVRGFGLSRNDCPVDPRGYVLTGLANPRSSILRGAVCDFVRAAQVGTLLEAGRGGTVFHGRSFGGSLALMAQVVSGLADYLAVAVPTFGWTAGRRRMARGGSGQEINDHLTRHPSDEAAMMRTLAYFDTVNFADRVRCRALVGVGLQDEVVPPATVYAIANHMVPRPEVMELPVSHTDNLEERHWVRFDSRWTAAVASGLAARVGQP